MPSFIAWLVVSSIVLIAVSVWSLLACSARRSFLDAGAQRRFRFASGLYLLGWIVLAFWLGSNGVLQATATRGFPALATVLALLTIIGAWLLYRSSTLKTVVAAIPLPWLVGVQLYRVVGLLFLALYGLGLMPGEFAIPAGWGDAATGLTAPVIGYLLYRGYRWSCLAALGWNVVGILDLVVAVATGFLSSPGPFQTLAPDNPNALITAFPLVLVPLYAVPMSILLHLAALKRLKAAVQTPAGTAFACGNRSPGWISHQAVS
jgi:hypothetical protein